MDPYSVIPKRTSRRSYTADDLSPDIKSEIIHILDSFNRGIFENEISFQLVSKQDVSLKKIKLGTYGFIAGAKYFIVGQTSPTKNSFIDYGYCLERIILELTNIGLGTCWLGGTFDRSEFSKAISLKPDCVIPAITPVGYATPNRSIGDRVIRAGAGSKKRKAWEELFFERTTLRPVNPDNMGDKANWLEMLRLAPSASNNQPWRILIKDKQIDLFLSRKPGYQKIMDPIDLQMVDMGIAMCHLNLVANLHGKSSKWTQETSVETVFDWEYIASIKF
jgi:hypothetical protein